MNFNSLILGLLLIPTALPQQWLLQIIGYWPDKLRLTACLALTILLRAASKNVFPVEMMRSPITWCTIGFFTCGLFSLIWSHQMSAWFTCFSERATRALIPIIVFAAATKKPSDLAFPLIGFAVVGFFTCCLTMYAGYLLDFKAPASAQANIWIFAYSPGLKNSLGQSCANMAVVAFAFWLAATRWRSKIPWFSLTGLAMLSIVVAAAKSNLLGAVSSFLLMLSFRKLKKRTLIAFCVMLAVGLVIFSKLMPDDLVAESTSIEGGSISARPLFWAMAFEHIAKQPLQPIGWGTQLRPVGLREVDLWNYCNVFLEDYIEGGFWAALVELAWFLACMWIGYRNGRRLAPNSIGAVANGAALGFIIINLSFGLVDSYWTRCPQMIPAFSGMGILIYLRIWLDQRDKLLLQRTYLDPD